MRGNLELRVFLIQRFLIGVAEGDMTEKELSVKSSGLYVGLSLVNARIFLYPHLPREDMHA